MSQTKEDSSRRRVFLKQALATGTALPLAAGEAIGVTPPGHVRAAPAAGPATASGREAVRGYLSLSQEEAAFVEAMVDLMCPADEWTPSGVDCGLATYIDRQLAGDFGRGSKRYSAGPWLQGKPEHGFQLPMTPEQHFKAGIEVANARCMSQRGAPFDLLPFAAADTFLQELAGGAHDAGRLVLSAWFNGLVYPLFNEACFADPIHGGNAAMVFWKMIGYPGLPATHTINMVRYRGIPYPGAADPKSIADFS